MPRIMFHVNPLSPQSTFIVRCIAQIQSSHQKMVVSNWRWSFVEVKITYSDQVVKWSFNRDGQGGLSSFIVLLKYLDI